ncbi:HEAT repeat domain-containing protein [Geotalea uraniireducens]|uniref:HEAT repeat domain-containing protein n=1 Tax=Geotalea uraniireducens TaxID=351604 RepID=UPI002492BB4C|nr:HEAT repeat domain-containing protein [Geotalea uraniireducens]
MDELKTLVSLLEAPEEEERRRAVIGLAGYPVEVARAPLFAAMGDSSWRVRKEAVNVLVGMSPDEATIDAIVSLLAAPDNAGLRNSAVEALERLGEQATTSLLHTITDRDHDVRKFVIDILGTIGDRTCLPALIAALADPDANVSAAAAENLGKLGDPRAVSPLVAALAAPDVWFRYSVLGALARLGVPVPYAVLAPLAAENLLKRPVFDCLGAVGTVEAAGLLVSGLTDRVRTVREAAAVALMRLRDRLDDPAALTTLDRQLATLRGTAGINGLLASLDAAEQTTVEAVVRILGLIGDTRAAVPLVQGVRNERLRRLCLDGLRDLGVTGLAALAAAYPEADDEERTLILHVWGELGYAAGETFIEEAMTAGQPALRRAAAVAVGKIGLTSLLGNIEALLADSDSDVRDGCIGALVRLAPAESNAVRPIAQSLAGAAAPERRRDAVLLYAALADVERLALLAKDEDSLVRRSAVVALAEAGRRESLGSLVMALVDEDAEVRIAAATGLGESGNAEVLAPLFVALEDEDPWVQCAILRSLGKLGSENALDAIEQRLSSFEGVVLIAALETLSCIKGPRALALVRRALDNPDEEVVKAAIGILANDGTEWLAESGERLLRHPHWDVRITFARALAQLLGEAAVPQLLAALDAEEDDLVRGQLRDLLGRWRQC